MSFPKRLHDALAYNEQKVAKGVADLLYLYGFLNKGADLNFHKKLEGLELPDSLNERATTKPLHVALTFSPTKRKLGSSILISIARDHVLGIGLGTQPYMVYCHRGAGHPHQHIVSATIITNRGRIWIHNLGQNLSSTVRMELQQKNNLIPAEGGTLANVAAPASIPAGAQYEREEFHRAIAMIVSHVFGHYAFNSLTEYNAALRSLSVMVDRGSEESRTCRQGSLVYRMLNGKGEKVGLTSKLLRLLRPAVLLSIFVHSGRQQNRSRE